MYSTGCPICGATEQPHKEGCMHRTCYRPMEAKDPLQGNTITELEEMVERQAGVDMVPAVEHVSPRRPVTQEDWDRWLGL